MSSRETKSTEPAAVLGTWVRRQLLARLEAAMALNRRGDAHSLAALHEVLSEAADRVAALQLGAAEGTLPNLSVGTRVCLPGEAGVFRTGEPVTEFLLIPFGDVTLDRPLAGTNFVFTQQHAHTAKQWFDALGRKLAIDYEHQSLDGLNHRQDGLRPAAGWIGGLEVRDDGLWAVNVSWTDRAASLLRSGEYRYFSPVIYWADEDQRDIVALGPVALTNDPAMHGVAPLAAGRAHADDPPDEIEPPEHGDESGDEEPIEPPPDEEAAPEPDFDADDVSVNALRRALRAVRHEAQQLRQQLAAQQADTFIERGLRLGKIVDATRPDWRRDYLRDANVAEARLSRAPVILPPGRVVQRDARGRIEPLRPRQARSLSATSGPDDADLAAYEQAVAAGRVLTPGMARATL